MGGWDFTIFQCCNNPMMCFFSAFVPCGCCCMQIYDAKITNDVNKNAGLIAGLCVCLLGPIGAIYNRLKLRETLKIEDSVVADILLTLYVPCCAVTQEWMHTMSEKKGNPKLKIWEL